MRLRTWHLEGLLVASALTTSVLLLGKAGDWREWLAALGVQLGFHHASVANRLQEAEEERTRGRGAKSNGDMCPGMHGRCGLRAGHDGHCGPCSVVVKTCQCSQETAATAHRVECVRWLSRYWVGKELAWVAYFLATGAVSPLVGCAVFLLHPLWRRWYRANFPRGRNPQSTRVD